MQQYITYAMTPNGRRFWLPIGSDDTSVFHAKQQLRSAGMYRIKMVRGREQGPIRLRPRSR